jgi:hypothetical protein
MNQAHVLDRSVVGDLGCVHETISRAEGREESLTAPDRSLAQRLNALEQANKIRTQRKELKLDLKAGRIEVSGLILDPPEVLSTMKLFDLLISVPKLGRTKVNRILTQCRISPSKTIGGLSERQRGEIVSYLRRR